MAPPTKPAGAVPSRAQLHEAALRHLARFSATEQGVVQVLERRVLRWARAAAQEGQDTEDAVRAARASAKEVGAALVQAGMIDDAAFAVARAARLGRAGRSRRAVTAHLAAKGVASGVSEAALAGAADELPSALAFARRRRLGPFRAEVDAEMRQKDLATLGRAGFPRETAERALAMEPEAALAIVLALKRG